MRSLDWWGKDLLEDWCCFWREECWFRDGFGKEEMMMLIDDSGTGETSQACR